jgi:hypothetical protein
LSAELQQVFHGLGASRPARDGGAPDAGAPPGSRPSADDDEVIDADFTVS